jgi:hypothetical protein
LDCLAFLANNLLACISNTFAFVRLRRVVAANFRSDTTNDLFVASVDRNLGVLLDHNFDSGRDWIQDRMAIPE